MMPSVEQVAAMIDHSLLRPELATDEVRQGCEIAARRRTASVCVRPSDVELAVEALAGPACWSAPWPASRTAAPRRR